ncbi:MAG: heme-copper oxidase subunit III [Acidobacteriota bacterium]|nr:heme-copper oxidase subunit III [Acidobacteriota bacterium]MDE3163353.1 heme-copper oxidase subunit III [Acidobacteriota bacterium]
MSTVAAVANPTGDEWKQPSRGMVGMACLIAAESAIFVIFVVAYIYYTGKSLSGPTPREVLNLPIFSTICLLSSSITVHFAVHELQGSRIGRFIAWLASTVLLGGIFIASTALEWYELIYHDGLTIRTNLFGTTFYSLVGLHASHVIAGLIMLGLALIFALQGKVNAHHTERFEVLSVYWHFVDAVWVVVFTVVYVLGR